MPTQLLKFINIVKMQLKKSDLYSLGAVIYFLFTGQQPPLAVQFQDVLNRTSGIGYFIKADIKKISCGKS